jgi:chromosome segregation ATPase
MSYDTRKRRTCETEGCERNSGDARFCRTCRAVRPYLATIAEQKSSLTRLRAERDAATTTVRQLTEQVGALTIERDEAKQKAQTLGHRLHNAQTACVRATEERDDCRWSLQKAHARHEETRNEARGLRADLDAAKVYATDQAKRLQTVKRERDDWQSVAVDRDRARDEVDTLRVRLRFMYAAAWVLLVGVVAMGVAG